MKSLKEASLAIGLARDSLARRVQAVEIIRAVASSSGVAGWLIWKVLPLLWAGIIGAAQLLDALKHVLAFSDQHTSASQLTMVLEQLMIDAEDEWEQIRLGARSTDSIRAALNRLKERRLKATQKSFPKFYKPSATLLARAASEAIAYMKVLDGEAERDG